MKRLFFKTNNASTNQSGAMEADTITKNGRSSKSHKSRIKFLTRSKSFFLFFVLMVIGSVEIVQAQRFDCKKDILDGKAIRFSLDPSSLTIGQRCDVSVFNSKGRKVEDRDFVLTSDNINVRTNDMSFSIEHKEKEDAWVYFVEGKSLEIGGNITISHKSCNFSHSFNFKVKQPFIFDNTLNCQGEKRELAVARYKNTINKNLYVVIDINQNQVYLLEAPLTIDGSGVKGADGLNGSDGQDGRNGLVIGGIGSHDGQNGTDGGDAGDGGNGGNGGEIIVHVPQNILNQVAVTIEGGRGGQGGQGGKGGQGGRAVSNGRAGRDGRDGRNGQYGQNGVRGNSTVLEDNNILKYFENIRHPYFKIEDIEL